MKRFFSLICVLLSVSLSAQESTAAKEQPVEKDLETEAQSAASSTSGVRHTCTSAGDTRVIEIIYEGQDKLPCRVNYTKGGEVSTLWTAASEEGYCEAKAESLLTKLEASGFSCSR